MTDLISTIIERKRNIGRPKKVTSYCNRGLRMAQRRTGIQSIDKEHSFKRKRLKQIINAGQNVCTSGCGNITVYLSTQILLTYAILLLHSHKHNSIQKRFHLVFVFTHIKAWSVNTNKYAMNSLRKSQLFRMITFTAEQFPMIKVLFGKGAAVLDGQMVCYYIPYIYFGFLTPILTLVLYGVLVKYSHLCDFLKKNRDKKYNKYKCL